MRNYVKEAQQIYEQKIRNGLVDVRFTLKDGAPTEAICEEIVRMEEAIRAGRVRPLQFGDAKPLRKSAQNAIMSRSQTPVISAEDLRDFVSRARALAENADPEHLEAIVKAGEIREILIGARDEHGRPAPVN